MREEGRQGGREGGREGEREGGRERGRERGRVHGREGGREKEVGSPRSPSLLLHTQLAAMTKSPYPLLDHILLGPWVALLNAFAGAPLSETLVLAAVVVREEWFVWL